MKIKYSSPALVLVPVFALLGFAVLSNPLGAAPRGVNLLANGDFQKGLRDWDATSWKRRGKITIDKEVLHRGRPTLRLESDEADHTMANQIIEVKPNTTYRLTAYVKTAGIRFLEKGKDGACLGIRGTFEKSDPVPATCDWRLLTFEFDSKNRTTVEVGPHLGWHASTVTGTAWFADLHLEEK